MLSSKTNPTIVASVQHELAKCVAVLLQPILDLYSSVCVPDTFPFSNVIIYPKLCFPDKVLVFFEIVSLFTNVPLQDTLSVQMPFIGVTSFLPVFLRIYFRNLYI